MIHAPADAFGAARRAPKAGRVLAAAALTLVLALALEACRQDAPGAGAAAGGSSVSSSSAPAAGARVVGQVRLSDGAAPDGVLACLSGTRHFAVADEGGHYAIDGVEPGTYRLVARLAGYKPLVLAPALVIGASDLGHDKRVQAQTLPRATGDSMARQATLAATKPLKPALHSTPATERLGSLAGTAFSAPMDDGQPASRTLLAGAAIALAGTPYRVASDEKGAFLFWSLPEGKYKLVATAPGFLSRSIGVSVAAGQQASARVELAPVASLRDAAIAGQVVLYDALGQLDNQFDKITVRLLDMPIGTGLDSDGAFALKGLARRRYVVSASGQGFGQATPVTVDLAQAQAPTTATVTLTLSATAPTTGTATAAQATGRVVGSAIKKGAQAAQDGADMSGIWVAVAGTQLTAVTDDKGNFTIAGVTPGTCRLIATAQGYKRAVNPSVQVVAGQDAKPDPLVLEPEHEAPRVVSTDPGDGDRDVIVRQEFPVTARFNNKMSPESLAGAVRVEPEVAFSTRVGGDSGVDLNVLQIMIAGTGAKNVAALRTAYTVTIGVEATDFNGVPMEQPYRFSFRTGGPAVIATNPADGGIKTAMGPREPVVIYFNAKMDPASLGQDALKIVPQTPSTPLLYVFEDSATGWSRLSVAAAWEPNTQYTLSVLGRARSAVGDALSNAPFSFSFKTPALIPISGPPGLPQRPIR